MRKKNSLLGIAIAIGVILLILLIIILSRSFAGGIKGPLGGTVGTIVLTQNGSQFSLDASGNAVWTKDGETKSALWSSDKTNSFFQYYYQNWAGSASVQNGVATVNAQGDELAGAVIGEGGNGGGSGGGGDDVSHYFGSPTPTPTGSGGSGGTGGTGGGDDGAPSWCKHWRLSYCADPPPDTSTPIPTATPIPGQSTPLPPDCNDPGNQQTGRTVIGNNLCLPTPTPTPTP